MSRIAHNTPMKAYDHITNVLAKYAGNDGIVSKKDAKKAVEDLRQNGRGTEALAAENIFKMLDAFNAEPNQRVTGYDFKASRGFVENKMLENRDANSNGFSQAEIAKMSPTGRALVELGRTLEIEAKRGRVAHNVPQQGMEHVASLLNQAAGKDGITSRKDRDNLISDLYKQGRGTEALAVGYFFGFIDARDYKPGNRVTADDINKAVEYSGTKLLTDKDANKNGYSKDEIAKFSTTAKAFLQVGQMIDAGIIKSAAA
jgi:hypothetical protein